MLCPVDTGNLRNSITHTVDGAGQKTYIGTNVEYAPYVELGHSQESGRYVPKLGKRLVASWVNGKPYLRPGVERASQSFHDIFLLCFGELDE